MQKSSPIGVRDKAFSFVVIVSARVSDWLSFANSSLTFEYNSVLFAKAYADSPDKEKSKREIKPKDENYSTFVNLRSLHYRMAGKQYCIKSNAVLYEGQKVCATNQSRVEKVV